MFTIVSNLKWWNNKRNNYLVFRWAGNENQLASSAQEGTAYILEASLCGGRGDFNGTLWIICADLD